MISDICTTTMQACSHAIPLSQMVQAMTAHGLDSTSSDILCALKDIFSMVDHFTASYAMQHPEAG